MGSRAFLQGICPTQGSETCVSCTTGGFFTHWATWESVQINKYLKVHFLFSFLMELRLERVPQMVLDKVPF